MGERVIPLSGDTVCPRFAFFDFFFLLIGERERDDREIIRERERLKGDNKREREIKGR